jgi:hypothetical protein
LDQLQALLWAQLVVFGIHIRINDTNIK